MSFLLPLPAIRPHTDGRRYDLVEPLRWAETDGTIGEVRPPFVTDGATTPGPLRTLAPVMGRHLPAAMRHDRRCDDLNTWHALGRPAELTPHLDAVAADREFLLGLRQLDPARPLRALVMWAGVRVGAWANPARRDGWATDLPGVLAVLLLVTPLYLPVAVVNAAAMAVDGLANRVACRLAPVDQPVPGPARLAVAA